MKAVILEIKNGYAAALNDDGTVVKIKDENYNVGDVIRMKENKPLFNKKWGTLVAALLIFAMVGTGTYVNAAPSFDIYVEDSNGEYDFAIRVNKLGKVVGVYNGTNKDEPIKLNDDELVLKGMSIEEAIDAVLLDQGWEDESIVTVAAKNVEDAEKLAQKIRERIAEKEGEGELERDREEKEVKGEVEKGYEKEFDNIYSITNEMVKEAKEEGIAPGKMNIINKIFTDVEEDFEIEIGDKTFGSKIEFLKEISETDDTGALMKDLMKAYSESKGNKDGVKFQEVDADELDKDDLNEDGKVNGKDTAPGQNKTETESMETGKPDKEKTNNGKGN